MPVRDQDSNEIKHLCYILNNLVKFFPAQKRLGPEWDYVVQDDRAVKARIETSPAGQQLQIQRDVGNNLAKESMWVPPGTQIPSSQI